jgi:hypothetical protein
MAYGNERGENVRFKHKKTSFYFKNLKYKYVGLMFLHFKDHL